MRRKKGLELGEKEGTGRRNGGRRKWGEWKKEDDKNDEREES